jgi:hypothetical protein
MPIQLFPFRYRERLTGRWVRARYRATREEIATRYAEWENHRASGNPQPRNCWRVLSTVSTDIACRARPRVESAAGHGTGRRRDRGVSCVRVLAAVCDLVRAIAAICLCGRGRNQCCFVNCRRPARGRYISARIAIPTADQTAPHAAMPAISTQSCSVSCRI